jgi:STE24 endopeptidase
MSFIFRLACLFVLAASASAVSDADAAIVRDFPPGLHVPEQAAAGPSFDVERATTVWLDRLSPDQRNLSDAYFEGGYWLHLWDLLYGLGVLAVLLFSGISRRGRDLAERISKRPLISVALYAALFLVASFVLGLPLSIYRGFIREHQYGLSNLSLAGWFGEHLIGLAVSVVLGSVVITLLYAGIRRAGVGGGSGRPAARSCFRCC